LVFVVIAIVLVGGMLLWIGALVDAASYDDTVTTRTVQEDAVPVDVAAVRLHSGRRVGLRLASGRGPRWRLPFPR
jgi:hypothetical protein